MRHLRRLGPLGRLGLLPTLSGNLAIHNYLRKNSHALTIFDRPSAAAL